MLKKRAYAKINLFLRILNKRDDGFHNIETIFYRINLFDELVLSPHYNILITSNNSKLPINENNFCYKAALELKNEMGIDEGVHINIQKNIPIGGGLGGGSSDAATVLKLLPKLWNIEVADNIIFKVAQKIGSDVPFFLNSKTSYARGRGDLLKETEIKFPFWILGIHPKFSVNTKWAYETLSKNRSTIPTSYFEIESFDFNKYLENISHFSVNDFEGVVFNRFEFLREIKIEIEKREAIATLLSGTGSSIFGIFENEVALNKAKEFFKDKYYVSTTPPDFDAE